jgi:hypothetical protein
VPWSNVKVKVSPPTTADTIGAGVLGLDSGAGQDAEAGPLAVHARGDGLGVGVACELPPVVDPHAAISITVATTAPTFTCARVFM